MKPTFLILACTFEGGIGYKNQIPWYLPREMKKFKEITCKTTSISLKNAVIMGKNTWLSLKRPLEGRLNIVISSNANNISDKCIVFNSLEDALHHCNFLNDIENIYIIGGSRLYNECLEKYNFDIYLSLLFYNELTIDTYFDLSLVFEKYILKKDKAYTEEHKNRQFASYICRPKKL
jgi:dihydrofolate reductase